MTQQNARRSPRFLDIDGVVNFRDLGGYIGHEGRRVKWGRVYRAGQLDRPTEHGQQQLRALKIGTVIDLRFDEETTRYPTNKAAMPNADFISWQDHYIPPTSANKPDEMLKMSWRSALDTGQPSQVREAMRINYPAKLDTHKGIYAAMLRRLIDHQTPLVFHCAAGKDRTGVGAAIILGLLGVAQETIVEDYLLTRHEVHKLREHFRAAGAGNNHDYGDIQSRLQQYPSHVVAPVFDADPEYIATLLDYVSENYGDFAGYARQVLGFDEYCQHQLRAALLAT